MFQFDVAPISKKYWSNKGTVRFNQKFGENDVPYYRQLGLLGHNGVDFQTVFLWKRIYNWTKLLLPSTFDTTLTDAGERLGSIPVLATHDGYLVRGKNNDRTRGIYMIIESEETEIYGRRCKVQTMYFHLDRLTRWMGDGIAYGDKPANFIRAGSILGFSDNTGEYTNGAHLHFGMYIYWKQLDGSFAKDSDNGYDGAVDPLLFFKDIVFESNVVIGSRERILNGKVI